MKFLKFKLLEAAQGDAAAGGGGESSGDQRTVEDRALEMGWIPESEFRGDKSKFIPAEDFVKRGESFMPILKANLRRYEARFDDVSRQNKVLQNQLSEIAAENEELKKGQTKASVEDLKAKRVDLAAELKIARDAGNTAREVEILAEVDEVNAKIRDGEKAVTQPTQRRRSTEGSNPALESPAFKAFLRSYPWYGTDVRKTGFMNAIGEEIKRAEPELEGEAFFNKVSEEYEKTFGGNQRRSGPSKVEGSARGTTDSSGSSNGKTWNDLPEDARRACDAQASRLVGPGKKFKDASEWRKHYVTKYFE